MQKSKVNAVLWMYSELEKSRYIKKEEAKRFLNVSNMTFNRYLKNIRLFLKEYAPSESVIYRKRENVYRLKKDLA